MREGYKYCRKCGRPRLKLLFTRNAYSPDGLEYQCREHNNIYKKRRRLESTMKEVQIVIQGQDHAVDELVKTIRACGQPGEFAGLLAVSVMTVKK